VSSKLGNKVDLGKQETRETGSSSSSYGRIHHGGRTPMETLGTGRPEQDTGGVGRTIKPVGQPGDQSLYPNRRGLRAFETGRP